MDSVDSDTWKDNSGIEHIRYPETKDKSDAELAVEYALEHGCEQIIRLLQETAQVQTGR